MGADKNNWRQCRFGKISKKKEKEILKKQMDTPFNVSHLKYKTQLPTVSRILASKQKTSYAFPNTKS